MTPRSRVAFLGTPDAAVPTLEALVGIADIPVVLTQPDRPQGRSSRLQPPPVKVRAVDLGLEVEQPERSSEVAAVLAGAGPLDAAVIVAYGRLIRPEALAVPRRGFLNVHFSVLPRWRGAAPVQRAMMAGDDRTGVSVMQLDSGLDTGPVVATWSTGIGSAENGGMLVDRLAVGGAGLLVDVLEPLLAGRLVATPQPDGATHAAKLGAEDRVIDWTRPAVEIDRQVRALSPRPSATTVHRHQPFKVLDVRALAGSGRPGVIDTGSATVGTGDGLIRLVSVQPAGRSVMAAADWLRGLKGDAGAFG